MKPCSECSGTKFYVIDRATQPDHESQNVIHTFHVVTAPLGAQEVGVKDKNSMRAAIGRFEIRICVGCGLTRWFARDLAPLEALRNHPRNNGVVRLEG